MFEGDSADMCVGKFPLTSMGDRAEGLACADPGARTPIGVSGNLLFFLSPLYLFTHVIIYIAFIENLVGQYYINCLCWCNVQWAMCIGATCV